jgi:hypothetical protein
MSLWVNSRAVVGSGKESRLGSAVFFDLDARMRRDQLNALKEQDGPREKPLRLSDEETFATMLEFKTRRAK